MRSLLALALGLSWVLAACVSDAPATDAAAPCSDPTFCDDKCGSGLADKCGLTRNCQTCGDGQTCDGNTHKCTCTELPGLCNNRCGSIVTNCNVNKDCGGCDGGACPAAGNCSGCVPNNAAACAGRECGTATNNCGQMVTCGANNGGCPNLGQCNNGKCCGVLSAICTGKCGMLATSCGTMADCGPCNSNETCTNNACACNCPKLTNFGNAVCLTSGCACANAPPNKNSDVANCGCPNFACPSGWSCKLGVCLP